MYSWAMRSSSSVGTPGATALPASASAPAAIRPATRIFSITSGVCTQGSVPSFAVGFHAYSGRSIELGTGRVGDTTPGRSAVRTGMKPGYVSVPVAAEPRFAWSADVDRTADHLAGQDDVRRSVRRCVLAVVVSAADDDLDIVDGRARPLRQPQVEPAELHIELDDDHRPRKAGPGEVEFDRSHSAVQRQPGRHGPLPLTLQRAHRLAAPPGRWPR